MLYKYIVLIDWLIEHIAAEKRRHHQIFGISCQDIIITQKLPITSPAVSLFCKGATFFTAIVFSIWPVHRANPQFPVTNNTTLPCGYQWYLNKDNTKKGGMKKSFTPIVIRDDSADFGRECQITDEPFKGGWKWAERTCWTSLVCSDITDIITPQYELLRFLPLSIIIPGDRWDRSASKRFRHVTEFWVECPSPAFYCNLWILKICMMGSGDLVCLSGLL